MPKLVTILLANNRLNLTGARDAGGDPWAAGMRRLRRKLAYLGLKNVRLLEQHAAILNLPDASIDLEVSNLGLNNFGNADAVLRTCRGSCSAFCRFAYRSAQNCLLQPYQPGTCHTLPSSTPLPSSA